MQARRNKGGTRARAHPIFGAISSKIVVVPTQYLSPIKCVPTQYLIPSYGLNINMFGSQNLPKHTMTCLPISIVTKLIKHDDRNISTCQFTNLPIN